MQNKSRPQPFAKRSLGQNFLVDQGVVNRILDAFAAGKDDAVLEIGPGRGALTEGLVKSAGRVYVIEFDNNLAARLRERFAEAGAFTVIEDDVLKIEFREISSGGRLRLISNLPYNISTVVLQKLFDYRDVFSDCVLMFQKEVAERITAKPGTKDRGYLSVLTEVYFNVTRLFDVAPGAFHPPPKIWSSVVRLIPTDTVIDRPVEFSKLVAAGFAQKRKTIANNLKTFSPSYGAALDKAMIDGSRRAETLTLDEWML
ncbi:MAG TPA: 16S rRNA (adenine(1518)-N(6)/adenine(1519)-N(6))-dimethyltransferase RsmA, partial [Pyrinomonadaceae bacterium]|nr:16S rRNA (adenine(1518)-N(6)/adenine(1519)-N(6))-dimethyltransferase RsmA [Pyrinomonadaceae bacterium]